jgi:hypothetical protein
MLGARYQDGKREKSVKDIARLIDKDPDGHFKELTTTLLGRPTRGGKSEDPEGQCRLRGSAIA